jgi:ethanolamine ammonia-lyase small subunit
VAREPYFPEGRLGAARVGLKSSGHALSTAECLQLQLDHARAKDAVERELSRDFCVSGVAVRSLAADRRSYLLRPDLGRLAHEEDLAALPEGPFDAAIVLADGLSALALERHAEKLVALLLGELEDWRLAPLVVARLARVAIGDPIGERMQAAMVLLLIGERPGLSSPDSLGAYLTFGPRRGCTDAERNCLSNIRPEGLSYEAAAQRLAWLMKECQRRKLSGVGLKDESIAGEVKRLVR